MISGPFLTEATDQPQTEAIRRGAFLIETDDVAPVHPAAISDTDESIVAEVEPARRSARGVASILFATGLAGFAGLWLGDWLLALATRHWLLALAGAVFAVAFTAGGLFWTLSEVRAVRRLHEASRQHAMLAAAIANDDAVAVRALLQDVGEQIGSRPADLARWARVSADSPSMACAEQFETIVLARCDEVARMRIQAAMRDTFGIVAISPTPITDTVVFVARAASMMRGIAEAYGHRPGRVATTSLLKRVLRDAGLVVATDLAGDALLHASGGVMHRLSAAAGEGAIAAHRMGRMGLIAMAACRPVPFTPTSKPKLRDLFRRAVPAEDF